MMGQQFVAKFDKCGHGDGESVWKSVVFIAKPDRFLKFKMTQYFVIVESSDG